MDALRADKERTRCMKSHRALALAVLLTALPAGADAPAPAAPPPVSAAEPAASPITPALAANFAGLALACVDRPFPYKPDKVLDDAAAVKAPRLDNPSFYGCFDWHSAVHGHWMLVRLARLFPHEEFTGRVRKALTPHFTREALAAEAAFVAQPAQQLFERPYGWAWALRLALELRGWNDPQAQEWSKNFAPLETALAARFAEYVQKLPHPVRTGIHGNTAFAMAQALDYAQGVANSALAETIRQRAREFYLDDRSCPVSYEPGGEDFFSPCLMEADLMRRVLSPAEFTRWLDRFLPGLKNGDVGPLARPATVTDRADGRIVHLDGLNLTRAWTMRGIAAALAAGDPRRKTLLDLVRTHAEAGLGRVASGHYEGEHWLASFAVYLASGAGLPGA